jgi:hypothetical protein
LVTFTVHLSAVVETLMVICTCVLLRKLTSPEVNVPSRPPIRRWLLTGRQADAPQQLPTTR